MDNSKRMQQLFGIGDASLKEAGLSFEELLCLMEAYMSMNTDAVKSSLVLKGYRHIDNRNGTITLILSESDRKKLESLLLKREERKLAECNRTLQQLKVLADKLREIYPSGYKYIDGRKYSWRDSTLVVAKRLDAWFKRYPNTHTDEQIIEATKRYVSSFNGNYAMMKVLIYFIMKNENRYGDTIETSLLKSEIENGGEETGQLDFDWTGEIR